MPKDNIVDLYEITISVGIQGIRARREKFKTKFTGQNFLPIRPSEAEEKEGYRHLSSRVPASSLMQIRTIGFGQGVDHCFRHGYCLGPKQQELFDAIRADITRTLNQWLENTTKMVELWKADTATLLPKLR